ncbi:MAG: FkbM family methyltransferase [Chitinophagaceae bacterium]
MVYLSPLVVRILNRLQLVTLFRVGYKLRLLNRTFKIPIIENKEGLIYHLGVTEPFLLHVFQQLYKVKNFTFLDAGVNFGQTLLKIKAVSAEAAYIGFEPSGLCSYYTSHLIKVNHIVHAKLIRCALSNETGVLTLHAQAEGDTRATILENNLYDAEEGFQELVPAVTLDSLISIVTADGNDIILKIDVEGAEWLVFQGAEKFINQFRPVIVFENLPCENDQGKFRQQQRINDFFAENNFKLYVIDEENKTLTNVEGISNKNEYLKTNYLAVPDEQRQLFSMLT